MQVLARTVRRGRINNNAFWFRLCRVMMSHVVEALRSSGAENIIIVTEANHRPSKYASFRSTLKFASFTTETEDAQSNSSAKRPDIQQRIAFFRSCAADQYALDLGGERGSCFTYYFAEGLSGAADGWGNGEQDGVITVGKAYAYAKAKVVADTRRANAVQVPQLERVGEQVNDIPLIIWPMPFLPTPER